MSREVGPDLPENLLEALSAVEIGSSGDEAGSSDGKAIVVASVDASGWPHPALLSYREVSALDRRTLRLSTYGRSNTAANLRIRARVTLVFVDERLAYYVKGDAAEVKPDAMLARDNPPEVGGNVEEAAGQFEVPSSLAAFNVTVRHVLEDAPGADEPGARITGGIVFERP